MPTLVYTTLEQTNDGFISSSLLRKPPILALTFYILLEVLWMQVWAQFYKIKNPIVSILGTSFKSNNL
jgi:hypothetical protein